MLNLKKEMPHVLQKSNPRTLLEINTKSDHGVTGLVVALNLML